MSCNKTVNVPCGSMCEQSAGMNNQDLFALRSVDNTKQMKYITHSFKNLTCDTSQTVQNEPGFQMWMGYGVGGCNVKDENQVKLCGGNMITNLRTRRNVQKREMTAPPFLGSGCSNIPLESNLIHGLFQEKSRPCLTNSYNETWNYQYLSHLGFQPQYAQSEGLAVACANSGALNSGFSVLHPRAGVNSRADLQNAFQASKN